MGRSENASSTPLKRPRRNVNTTKAAETQRLEWCREHIPGFADCERSALAMIAAAEANRRALGLSR